MILVSGGIKGGSGKSTVAVNLTIMQALAGRDVLLVDADDQETATDFTILRNDTLPEGAGYTSIALRGKAIRNEVQRLAPKYDDVIIDCGGRDTTNQRAALSIADYYLVPFVPRSFDVWTLDKVTQLIEEVRAINPELRAVVFLNRADHQGHDNEDAEALLADVEGLNLVQAPLGNRKAFSNAAASGLSVVEYKPRDDKAIAEIERLHAVVFDTVTAS
jgi:chromosome partitioning protein